MGETTQVTAETRERISGRRVVASVSGGKDSAAMSLWLTELGIEHDRVFMDTGWEHPATYEYLRGPLTAKLGPITEIRAGRLMEERSLFYGMFPSRERRWCTRDLKVEPMKRHLASLQDAGIEPINAVGIRGAESAARASMTEWEQSVEFDCDVWRPLLTWTDGQVVEIHARHGLRPNPLYLLGATRVGCWPCIFSRKEEIRFMADVDPERIIFLRTLEARMAAVVNDKHDRQGRPRRSPPAWFQRTIPGAGETMCVPIDEAVRWSKTSRGGRQFEMFAPDPRDAGCMRWGLCETSPNEQREPRREDEEAEEAGRLAWAKGDGADHG